MREQRIARFSQARSAYDRGVGKAGRKPWRSIAVGVGVVFVAVACLVALRRDPYSFLYSFHPRIVDVDLARALGAPPPGTKGAPVFRRSKITMLVFKPEDAEKVLIKMKAELTPDRGYSSKQLASPPNNIAWDFAPGPFPTTGGVAKPNGTAEYAFGNSAAFEEQLFERGTSHMTYWNQDEKPACIVLLVHQATWLDRGLDTVRALLHIG